jgi:predicted RNA polymerase sigma factor
VVGLTTGQIAHAFLVPEATMAQRISRAKKALADGGARFQMLSAGEFPGRLGAVLHVLYLIFIQAAIAAVHSEAPDTAATDWPQILGLYALLEQTSPSPVVALNRAVALAMVYGPEAGLRLLDGLDNDRKLASQHRLPALRGHLHGMAGNRDAARAAYLAAARRATSLPEKR